MKQIKSILIITLCLLSVSFCVQQDETSKKVDSNLAERALLFTAFTYNKEETNLTLNGAWNSFTGTGTTTNTITTISATLAKNGSWIDDSSGFGGYTSAYVIAYYDNKAKVIITQNPPNNGAYTGDTTKGKYSKILWTENTAKAGSYYYCSIVNGKSTITDALNDTKTADSSNISTGCGGFSWSRIEAK